MTSAHLPERHLRLTPHSDDRRLLLRRRRPVKVVLRDELCAAGQVEVTGAAITTMALEYS